METTANMLAHRLRKLVAETTDREQLSEEIRRLLELERARLVPTDETAAE